MEGLGEKFRKAREARNLTLEEAARMTKIRPNKLAEIEAEDFSKFPSLAYAKGFLLIYGKFLHVDVSPYLDAFESSEHITVDGYSYLRDNDVPPPRRTEIVRKPTRESRSSLMPLVIGLVILVGGWAVVRFMMDIQRIKPTGAPGVVAEATTTPSAAVGPGSVDGTPAPAVPVQPETPSPAVAVTPAVAAAVPLTAAPAPVPVVTPEPTSAAIAEVAPPDDEPEVRRAEPVNPDDLIRAEAALKAAEATPGPSPSPNSNVYSIRPLRKTFVRVVVDGKTGGKVERWVEASEALQFKGQRIAVKALDPAAVEIWKNGKPVSRGDIDVRLE
ncbi:hypothetical protein BH20VER1_BH20VER1_30800 [soil metagenome]